MAKITMKAILLCMIVHAALGAVIYVKVESGTLPYYQTKYIMRGTYSFVYSATDTDGRAVALKIANLATTTDLFSDECRIYKKLGVFKPESKEILRDALNAGLPEILEYGTIAEETDFTFSGKKIIGHSVIIMELTGKDLHSAYMDCETRRPLSTNEWIRIGIKMVNTLDYVHSKGVIHGDIKPENFVLSCDDHRVLLIDFGAAKLETDDNLSEIKGGTTMYMSLRATLAYAFRKSILDEQHQSISLPEPSTDDDSESLMVTLYILKYKTSWGKLDDDFVNFHRVKTQLEMQNLKTETEVAKIKAVMGDIIQEKAKFCAEIRSTFKNRNHSTTLANLFVDTINFSRRGLDARYRPRVSRDEIDKIDSSKFVERWLTEYNRFHANANFSEGRDIVEHKKNPKYQPIPLSDIVQETRHDNPTWGENPTKPKEPEKKWYEGIFPGCVSARK